jgi:lipopolysaccharide transport system ATP-binding protein
MATAGGRALPDFVIIGAPKCGTTSLFSYLVHHPLVLGSATKEVHYADREANVARGERWYRAWFPPTATLQRVGRANGVERAICGEATPNYLGHPDAPARLHRVVPDARLLVLLREPGARAWSQFRWSKRWGGEDLDFAEAIATEAERLPGRFDMMRTVEQRQRFMTLSYLTRGLYAEQLEWWYEAYPRDQILVLRSEDLFGDPSATYRRTVAFLGLPDLGEPDYPVRNQGTGPTEIEPVTRAWLDDWFAEPNRRLAELTGGAVTWP